MFIESIVDPDDLKEDLRMKINELQRDLKGLECDLSCEVEQRQWFYERDVGACSTEATSSWTKKPQRKQIERKQKLMDRIQDISEPGCSKFV